MIKRKIFLSFFFILLFAAGFNLFDIFRVEAGEQASRAYGDPSKYYRLSEAEKGLMQSGDIILRKGHGSVSDIIDNMYPTGYHLSHCAVVIRDPDSLYVIHTVSSELSMGDGVQTEGMDKFVRESVRNSIILVRPRADSLTRIRLAEASKSFLNKQIPFDNAFDISDTTQFYCTELIFQAYRKVYGKDMFPERLQTDHPNYLGIDALLDTTRFDRIITHQKFDPKHLPKAQKKALMMP